MTYGKTFYNRKSPFYGKPVFQAARKKLGRLRWMQNPINEYVQAAERARYRRQLKIHARRMARVGENLHRVMPLMTREHWYKKYYNNYHDWLDSKR